MTATFFTPGAAMRAWLEANHGTAPELNIKRVEELRAQGLMHEAGIRAFERRRT